MENDDDDDDDVPPEVILQSFEIDLPISDASPESSENV
jgi:hypothetical protein